MTTAFKFIIAFAAGELTCRACLTIFKHFKNKYYSAGYNDGYSQGKRDRRNYKKEDIEWY